MKVLVIGGLSDTKLFSKIQPLLSIETIREIYLVRRKPLSVDGVENFCPPGFIRRLLPLAEIFRLLLIFYICLWKRPDKIIAFYIMPHGVYGWFAGTIFRIHTIQMLVGTDLDRVVQSRFLQYILGKGQYIGLRGEKTLARLQTYGIDGHKVFFPPNVFNIDKFKPNQSVEKKYDFVFLGDLVPPKRLDMLVRSVALLTEFQPDVRVALIGDGILRRELEGLVSSKRVEKNIFFLGAVKQEEVSMYLNMGSSFIMTSRIEGLPMAMIEALSCGLPVIMPDVGDVTSIAVNNVNGLIVHPATEEGFAEAMRSLMENKPLYEQLKKGAVKSREKFRQEYSLETAVRIWKDILGLNGK